MLLSLVSVVLMAMILHLHFRSLRIAFLVLLTRPIAFLGAVAAVVLTGRFACSRSTPPSAASPSRRSASRCVATRRSSPVPAKTRHLRFSSEATTPTLRVCSSQNRTRSPGRGLTERPRLTTSSGSEAIQQQTSASGQAFQVPCLDQQIDVRRVLGQRGVVEAPARTRFGNEPQRVTHLVT